MATCTEKVRHVLHHVMGLALCSNSVVIGWESLSP